MGSPLTTPPIENREAALTSLVGFPRAREAGSATRPRSAVFFFTNSFHEMALPALPGGATRPTSAVFFFTNSFLRNGAADAAGAATPLAEPTD